jgi:hypothetical protein
MTVFWNVAEVLAASIVRAIIIALMMEAARTSETLVNFYQTTRRNNPDDSYLHTRRREDPKSHGFKGAYCLQLRELFTLVMEAGSTSETSVNFYQTTRRNILEDSHLHTRRRESLKSLLQNCSDSCASRIC